MSANTSSQFASDVEAYIAEKTLPLVQRQLVVHQFGEKINMPAHRGTTYTASRYDRINLPMAPLSEGVPPVGETMSVSQVTATAQQWGDTVTITDVADLTIKHPIFAKAVKLVSMQVAETLERNTFNALLAGTQINYASYDNTARTNRAGIRNAGTAATSDILTPHEINRAVGALITIGAPQFSGQREEDAKVQVGKYRGAGSPAAMAHFAAVMHPLVEQDMNENTTISTAWSRSDINRLYTNELGVWGGVRFTRSNMVPFFVGVAQVNGTGASTGGSLAAGTYYAQVTGFVAQSGYEQRIHQVSTAITVGGTGNGSFTITTPNLPGYTFAVYVGTTTSPGNLGLCAGGPTSGPLAGRAILLAPNTTYTITGIDSVSRVPPAAPATGITVYPTFIFGEGAYGQVELENVKFSYLKGADKSDPLNQLRVIGWKTFYGTIITNQQFFMRIESTSLFSSTFG